MKKDLFTSLDLNLLRTFLILSQELNMRKASERLFVSQPAISQSLAKLRHHFDDELFVKVQKGLQATPFAEALATSISPHMYGLANSVNNHLEFSPETLEKSVKIALSPVVLASLSGSLYQAFKKAAPNAIIDLVSWSGSTVEDLKRDNVYLAISYEIETPSEVYAKKLVGLSGQVIVRNEHPIKKTLTTPADYAGYEIASMVSPGFNENFSIAADIMQQYGFESKVGFRSEIMMALIDIIQHTDMYLPHTNLFPIHLYPNLRTLDIDIGGKGYMIDVYSYCHSRHRNTAMFNWLHNLISAVIQEQLVSRSTK
ncbi:LysR family transcriptional regulator [Vibrio sp. DW001]|uniref:LysR family transcriptional regulator n=1 Tax=Vibrio sp. DW001 TaxID=2912315 RepID=UPI0023AEC0EE|nr:LysR family transcriptional regulator [Vibrio sp. DW001]WED28819.1 LysR family transcriptional regulator [Vibrio sp. DW001]